MYGVGTYAREYPAHLAYDGRIVHPQPRTPALVVVACDTEYLESLIVKLSGFTCLAACGDDGHGVSLTRDAASELKGGNARPAKGGRWEVIGEKNDFHE